MKTRKEIVRNVKRELFRMRNKIDKEKDPKKRNRLLKVYANFINSLEGL